MSFPFHVLDFCISKKDGHFRRNDMMLIDLKIANNSLLSPNTQSRLKFLQLSQFFLTVDSFESSLSFEFIECLKEWGQLFCRTSQTWLLPLSPRLVCSSYSPYYRCPQLCPQLNWPFCSFCIMSFLRADMTYLLHLCVPRGSQGSALCTIRVLLILKNMEESWSEFFSLCQLKT